MILRERAQEKYPATSQISNNVTKGPRADYIHANSP